MDKWFGDESNNSNNMITIYEVVAEEMMKESEQDQLLLSKKYAILDRVQEKAKRFGAVIPQNVLDEIGKLVMSVKGSVAVTTRRAENPRVAECGNILLEYALEEAAYAKTNKPYLLSLWFVRSEQDLQRVSKTEVLKKWLLGKRVPLATELLDKLDAKKDVTVRVYRYILDFAREAISVDNLCDDDFVGQKVQNGAFSRNDAVGIVKENKVIIYAPEWMFNKSMWEFYSR